jgi:hypothetical protein
MTVERLPAAQRATEQSQLFRELMTLIRSRTDATAKGLAAVGTAAVSAIGYTKFTQIFPYHGPLWALLLLGCGAVAMITAVIFLVKRFDRIADTVLTFSNAEKTCTENGLNEDEEAILKREYEGTAELNEVASLQAYNARAHRFERIADATADEDAASLLRARADVIRAEVLATEDRAVVFILRHRAKTAFFNLWAVLLLLLFFFGWYATGLAANALEAKRAEAKEAVDASGFPHFVSGTETPR